MRFKKSVNFFLILVIPVFLVCWNPTSANRSDPQIQESILYVKPNAIGITCSTWEDACDLDTALFMSIPGNQIWVAAGIYKPVREIKDRGATFQLRSGVAIYGGFAGTETDLGDRDWETNISILSGDIGAENNNFDNCYHVVFGENIDSNAVLDGFTITAGQADAAGMPDRLYGGGLYVTNSYLTLRNLIFYRNAAAAGGGIFNELGSIVFDNVTFSENSAGQGGGMYMSNTDPILNNIVFSGNTASGSGGGMYSFLSDPQISNVTFSENTAMVGGGMFIDTSNPMLINAIFHDNSASMGEDHGGGGMYNGNSNPILIAAEFIENSARDGGGMYNWNSDPVLNGVNFYRNFASNFGGGINNYNYSDPILNQVTLNENSATYGGGIASTYYSSPSLTNVTISGNTATHGGGIYTNGQSSSLTSVTITSNSATSDGGGILNVASNLTINNAIIWGNTGGQISNQFSSAPTINYSIIEGGGFAGEGNLNQDPLLGPLADNGGFTLTHALPESSPAIDTGDPNNCPISDQRNFVRPVDGDAENGPRCDMGAYEFGSSPILYSLDIQIIGGGEVVLEPDQQSFERYETVTLTATADPGWYFSAWTGDLTMTSNPLEFTLFDNTAINANFSRTVFPIYLPLILR